MKSKPVEFLPAAQREVEDAYLWYEQQEPGVGERFLKVLGETLLQIKTQPDWGTPHIRNTRKVQIEKFPYTVIYREETDKIAIYTVAHGSRKPGYWIDRV